jgi:hypothetical protein
MVKGTATGLARSDSALKAVGYDKIPPSASGALRAFRHLGYKLHDALADLIDNSIDARAKTVVIRFVHTPDEIVRVFIADDGAGMSEAILRVAMQFGGETDHRTSDLGKFGMGLKTASFSQCRCLSVISRAGGTIVGRQWTEAAVKRGWSCGRLDPSSVTSLLDQHWSRLKTTPHGTVVVWDDLDRFEPRHRRINDYLDKRIDNVKLRLGTTFHRFLERKQIRIYMQRQRLLRDGLEEEVAVQQINPFNYPETGDRHYPRDFSVDYGKKRITLRAHIWPPKSRGAEFSQGGQAAARQGFYFYRNDRLIQAGGWSGLRQQDDEPHLTLARVEVDLPPELDGDFAVQAQKAGVDVPPAFLEAVNQSTSGALSFADYLKDAQQVYRRKKERSDDPVVPGKGFPRRVRSRARKVLVADRRLKVFAEYGARWTPLEPGQFFDVDRNERMILLNSDYRRVIARNGGNDGALFKSLLFMFLRDHLDRKMTARRLDWLAACNQVLAAAYRG